MIEKKRLGKVENFKKISRKAKNYSKNKVRKIELKLEKQEKPNRKHELQAWSKKRIKNTGWKRKLKAWDKKIVKKRRRKNKLEGWGEKFLKKQNKKINCQSKEKKEKKTGRKKNNWKRERKKVEKKGLRKMIESVRGKNSKKKIQNNELKAWDKAQGQGQG